MRKHGGTPSWRDKQVTLAAISPPGVARGRFVGGQQSGLAGSKPPPLFTRGASSCSSQGRRQGEPWGASPRTNAPTYLPQCQTPWNPCSKMVNDPDANLDVIEDIMATEIHTGGGYISGDDKIDVDKFGTPTWYQICFSILRMRCVKLCAGGMGCRRRPSGNQDEHGQ